MSSRAPHQSGFEPLTPRLDLDLDPFMGEPLDTAFDPETGFTMRPIEQQPVQNRVSQPAQQSSPQLVQPAALQYQLPPGQLPLPQTMPLAGQNHTLGIAQDQQPQMAQLPAQDRQHRLERHQENRQKQADNRQNHQASRIAYETQYRERQHTEQLLHSPSPLYQQFPMQFMPGGTSLPVTPPEGPKGPMPQNFLPANMMPQHSGPMYPRGSIPPASSQQHTPSPLMPATMPNLNSFNPNVSAPPFGPSGLVPVQGPLRFPATAPNGRKDLFRRRIEQWLRNPNDEHVPVAMANEMRDALGTPPPENTPARAGYEHRRRSYFGVLVRFIASNQLGGEVLVFLADLIARMIRAKAFDVAFVHDTFLKAYDHLSMTRMEMTEVNRIYLFVSKLRSMGVFSESMLIDYVVPLTMGAPIEPFTPEAMQQAMQDAVQKYNLPHSQQLMPHLYAQPMQQQPTPPFMPYQSPQSMSYPMPGSMPYPTSQPMAHPGQQNMPQGMLQPQPQPGQQYAQAPLDPSLLSFDGSSQFPQPGSLEWHPRPTGPNNNSTRR